MKYNSNTVMLYTHVDDYVTVKKLYLLEDTVKGHPKDV